MPERPLIVNVFEFACACRGIGMDASIWVPRLTSERTDNAPPTLRTRSAMLKQFDTLRRDIDASGVLEGLDTFKAQALEMVTGDRVREAFDIDREDPRLRSHAPLRHRVRPARARRPFPGGAERTQRPRDR